MTRCGRQISDKERELEFTTLFKDVAGVIADKCINPDTQRPYTLSMVERALRDVHFSVDPKRGAKQQALQARLPLLQLSLLHACALHWQPPAVCIASAAPSTGSACAPWHWMAGHAAACGTAGMYA